MSDGPSVKHNFYGALMADIKHAILTFKTLNKINVNSDHCHKAEMPEKSFLSKILKSFLVNIIFLITFLMKIWGL